MAPSLTVAEMLTGQSRSVSVVSVYIRAKRSSDSTSDSDNASSLV